MNYDLERFVSPQAYDYERALAEIRNGKKQTHWMWYIFPQLRGLGRSGTALYYGISGLKEARAYLSHPVLGPRLRQISQALLDQGERDAAAVFGFPDVLKLRSCMTLFDAASGQPDNVFIAVLNAFYKGERDDATLRLLEQRP